MQMVRVGLRALAVFAAIALPQIAGACSLARVSGADVVVPASGRINEALIDAAIRAEVNYQRCRAGLSELAAAPGLAEAASTHAKWMARAQTMSHESKVPGQSSVLARLQSSGIDFRAGSENIGKIARYGIDGIHFRIRDAGACAFATQDGTAIGAHSYQSLARHIVTLWVNSPKHRTNMLDPKVRMVGSGAGYDPSAPYCGAFYVSQNYAG
ncbi:CAP domain-containing protein [Phaeovulum sp.]|uniref:CAP domain-containing protein n=1 Tax=Phaeovulum sp. TaxID=2934796 RepID=UPI002730D41D|nr:CAP domain-containing protein [Phaeovulum sp.]MDP1670019.1 CAP domain-containing protein [Phaeovulum sp.]MDP2061935.1 CAP domain-containing protein [Phaeovulum sp.]MDZ4119302.1 CAP domain-containing protein [Phaeovulum sp.]